MSSHEMVLLYRRLEGDMVNLAMTVFHRIMQVSVQASEDKFYTTLDLPYGVWISKILENKGVIGRDSYGVQLKDEMSDVVLGYMKIAVVGPELIFKVKGEVVAKNDEIHPITEKLDEFMSDMRETMANQTRLLENMVAGMSKDGAVNPMALGRGSSELIACVKAMEEKFEDVRRLVGDCIHEFVK